MTARFGKDQGTYLGTIVRKGNGLVFAPAKPIPAVKSRQGQID